MERKTIEQWAEQKGTEAWLVAATKAGKGWATGRELTEAEFDAAVSGTATTPIGYDVQPIAPLAPSALESAPIAVEEPLTPKRRRD